MAASQTNYAEKFERLLELFPHPDRQYDADPQRRKWKMIEIARATEGRLSSSYLSSLRTGRNKNPGMEYLDLIAHTMGFPFELWLTEPQQWDRLLKGAETPSGIARSAGSPDREQDVSVSALLEQLVSSITNRYTGEAFTNREIADHSGGRISEDEVRAMRGGELENPSRLQLLALCDVFGVELSYWSEGIKMPILSQEDIEMLRTARNSSSRMLLRKTLGLDQEQVDVLLMMADQLNPRTENPSDDDPNTSRKGSEE